MSELWVAGIVTVAGSYIAGKGQEKKDKADKAHQEAMTKEESALAAQRTGYEMALEEWYTQRERARTQRGLDQFRQFSTMRDFAPQYDETTESRIVPGDAPNYNDFDPTPPEEAAAGGGKKGSSLLDKGLKYDPVLRPIHDLKKLF